MQPNFWDQSLLLLINPFNIFPNLCYKNRQVLSQRMQKHLQDQCL
jgi:hypothetical protein